MKVGWAFCFPGFPQMPRPLFVPNLRALAAEMRQFFPQRPQDCARLKKLRDDNRAKFERWQQRQLST